MGIIGSTTGSPMPHNQSNPPPNDMCSHVDQSAEARGRSQTSINGWIKLALLSSGLTTSSQFNEWFSDTSGYVRRRNFYNSPGAAPGDFLPPQEIRLTGEAPPVTVAVNNYGPSPWQITLDISNSPVIVSEPLGLTQPIELLADLNVIHRDPAIARLCNLYGGSALSFFSPRACYFFADGTECQFCSLAGTATESAQYAARITPAEVGRSVSAVVVDDRDRLTQIMIVGGNERNLNRGFLRQVALVRAAASALENAGLEDSVSVHLIVMPPQDLRLIDHLRGVANIRVGFNVEIWDRRRFDQIAPGKRSDYGQSKILAALQRLRDVVGPYRAHSILIAGLESPQSTIEGAGALAEEGISPIINAYHSDRHSKLALTVRPSYEQLAEVAVGLQNLHDQYPIQPYWKGCGRNALDFEASTGMFRGTPPNLR